MFPALSSCTALMLVFGSVASVVEAPAAPSTAIRKERALCGHVACVRRSNLTSKTLGRGTAQPEAAFRNGRSPLNGFKERPGRPVPQGWEHINLTGDYDRGLCLVGTGGLRRVIQAPPPENPRWSEPRSRNTTPTGALARSFFEAVEAQLGLSLKEGSSGEFVGKFIQNPPDIGMGSGIAKPHGMA